MRITRWGLAAAAALMLSPLSPMHAQRIAIVAGGTFSQLRGLDDVEAQNRRGTMFGAQFTVPVGAKLSLQPEVLFVNKGSKFDITGDTTRNVRLDYLEIPLLLRVDAGPGMAFSPHLYAGPSIAYNVGCNVKLSGGGIPNTSSDCNRTNFLEPQKVEWGAIVGAGVDLSLGGFGVTTGARYGIGLSNVSKDDNVAAAEQRVRNGTLTVYVGLLFGQR